MKIIENQGVSVSSPSVVVGLPDVGLVGTIASSFLVESLSIPEIGHIDSELEPPLMIVHGGEPRFPIRMYGRNDLTVIVSDISLTPRLSFEFSNAIVDWCLEKRAKILVGMAGLPSSRRMDQKEEMPSVFYVTNRKDIVSMFGGSFSAKVLEEGFVVGTYAQLLKRSIALGQPNVTLLAESHLEFPDPGAAAATLVALKTLLGVEIEVKQLMEESEQIRVRSRELMRRAQQSMQQMGPGAPSVYA